jgi:hypothetical protein
VTLPVTFKATAFPQPHEGDPITLSNTQVVITIPASTLQQGVTLGLIKDGDKIPSKVTAVIDGSSTTQKTQTFKVDATATVVVKNGQAQPLTATVDLPNSKWNPLNNVDPVIFTEKSVKIVATIDLTSSLGFVLTATFTCAPSSAPPFVGLAAQGTELPSTTTTTIAAAGATETTTTVAAASTGSTLPRTGANVLFLLVIAAILVDLGFVLQGAARRRRHT